MRAKRATFCENVAKKMCLIVLAIESPWSVVYFKVHYFFSLYPQSLRDHEEVTFNHFQSNKFGIEFHLNKIIILLLFTQESAR